ncbi:protein kinase family protein [Litchfieldia alkalitelluris]|uniref:hypothetical protein n=1 Tax=Litchfieldia alkalitelluris TaxID=304268 RepID=UPI000996A281|nr:hypothetical protein [Litchfieldia alkalitelluris]
MQNLEKQIQSVIYNYFGSVPSEIYKQNNGYNNTTRLINVNGEQFILRVYQTHNDHKKVELEHEVLLKLNKKNWLTFQVPVPLLLPDGRSYLKLLDGSEKIACIYR